MNKLIFLEMCKRLDISDWEGFEKTMFEYGSLYPNISPYVNENFYDLLMKNGFEKYNEYDLILMFVKLKELVEELKND